MKKRILFVDDEPRVLEGLEDLLVRQRRKWDMVFIPGAMAALEQMRQAPFDVIVTDMRMPEMDGAALLQIVRREYPGSVRILLSGHSSTESTIRTLTVAHQFLNKPCAAGVLEKTVERACDFQSLMRDERIRKIVGGIQQLPSLPSVFAALQRKLAVENSSVAEIASIIAQDISISAKVLQLVNSAFFGLGRRITRIHDAVAYLGYGMIQKLVLATEVFSSCRLDPRSGLSAEGLRDHSLLTAGIAWKIMEADRAAAEDAWTAGLLHDIGKLILAAELPEHLAAATALARKTGIPCWQAECEIYGVSHAEIGAHLLGLWGLPYPVAEAVANHHTPERVPAQGLDALRAVYVANALAHECENGGESEKSSGGEKSAAGSDPVLDGEYLASLGLAHLLPEWRESARELAASRVDR